ncbi:hypothetical protein BwSH20_54490 [Bradyrhizobium ottawaense]|nr:hypothetical protein SG09_50020 [Bradyrhizobium ottawaense]GMO21836.1 hypothetical protein BwSF12_13190 [Bradyrhizobium ottawaense]GMO35766.1 hypothetical protein BwSH14_41720 [Bradyrhizobium ottawaense]GMO61844.1 hypothetical protein BwSH17_08820 [Bradyrhizobium ottawaense]GMO72337.1 hypothetical protein BwSG10_32600 [Bradyrhizobium ottawaense]
MKTVQVISDAKASPIITAFTMTSADMNITQGDNSFIAGAMPAAASGLASGLAVVETAAAEGTVGATGVAAVEAEGAGTAGVVAAGAAGAGPAGAG